MSFKPESLTVAAAKERPAGLTVVIPVHGLHDFFACRANREILGVTHRHPDFAAQGDDGLPGHRRGGHPVFANVVGVTFVVAGVAFQLGFGTFQHRRAALSQGLARSCFTHATIVTALANLSCCGERADPSNRPKNKAGRHWGGRFVRDESITCWTQPS